MSDLYISSLLLEIYNRKTWNQATTLNPEIFLKGRTILNEKDFLTQTWSDNTKNVICSRGGGKTIFLKGKSLFVKVFFWRFL